MTAVANAIFTAAQFNTHVRDNLLETAPGKAANAGGYFVVSAANAIVERQAAIATVATSETTTSTAYTDLTTSGPAVTATTGTKALVIIGSESKNSDAIPAKARTSFAVSGDTTIAASDAYAVGPAGTTIVSAARAVLLTTLTAGSNTFTAKYKVTSGTGTFENRSIIVLPL